MKLNFDNETGRSFLSYTLLHYQNWNCLLHFLEFNIVDSAVAVVAWG